MNHIHRQKDPIMTNQQAPEIYTLHTVPNKGERPWSGIYTVRADAEHDAKVMRDVTGRDWSVVRLVVADTAATPTGPITRYEVVDCIDSKHVPAVIPNGAGPWVRYEDHVTALAAGQATAAPAQPAAQQGAAYAALPEKYYLAGGEVPTWDAKQMHAYADATHALRASHGQAPATQQVGEVVAYLDVGANGYMDLGSELSEDALQQLPKGRHALVIAGTYGIDGYVAAPQLSPAAIGKAVQDAVLAACAPADGVTAPAGGVVAYLDIGAGGYLDLSFDLSNEAISRLPKGRHALIIAGTYGIDGYTPTPPAQVADNVLADGAEPVVTWSDRKE